MFFSVLYLTNDIPSEVIVSATVTSQGAVYPVEARLGISGGV
jgi:hypothetical protein